MADESANTISIKIEVPGAKDATQQMAGFAGSLKQTSQALKDANGEATKTGNAFKKTNEDAKRAEDSFRGMALGSARSAAAINIMGGELSQLNPQMATMVQAVGRASGAVSGFTSLIGGVGGLAAGGLVAAIGLWIDYTRRAKEEQERLAKAAADTKKAMMEERDAAHSLATSLLDTRTPEQLRILRDAGQLELQLSRAHSQGDVSRIGETEAALAKLREQSRAETFRIRNARDLQRINDLEDTIPDRQNKTERDRGGFAEWQRAQGVLGKMQADEDRKRSMAEQTESDFRLNTKLKAIDAEDRARKKQTKDIVADAKQRDDQLARIDDRTSKRYNEMREAGISAFSAVGAQGVNALQRLAKGQKVTIKDFLSGVGDEMVAEGTRYGFKGAAELLLGNPGGAAVAAIGAAEIAAGLALGAATRGGTGTGGGGPSVASGPTYWNGTAFVRGQPYSPSGGQTSSGQFGNTSVVVNLPTQIRATSEDGVNVMRAIKQAQREGRAA